QIASLRFAGICTDLTHRVLLERRKSPLRWAGPLWTYVDVRDAAIVCRLAIEANFSGHEAFNVCAPNTIMKTPTAALVREYLPGINFRIAGRMEIGVVMIPARRESCYVSQRDISSKASEPCR